MKNKKISQFQEVLSVDSTSFVPIIQGSPYFNAVIKPQTFIYTGGGMLTKDYVGINATESVNNSDKLGNIPAEDYVTYTNNDKDVDLSNNSLSANGIKLNTTNPLILNSPGQFGWNDAEGTVDIRLLNNTTLQSGQETYFYGKAIEFIANGDPVMIAGVQGNHLTFKNAVYYELSEKPYRFLGIATQNINTNNFGYITWFGKVNGVYTTGWNEADNLYISPINSKITTTQPQAPNIIIRVGSVIKKATGNAENGIIGVRPTFGIRMTDLNDVNGTPLNSSGQIPVWNNTSEVFDFTENINDYQKISEKAQPNGYASLYANGKLVTNQETDPIFTSSPANNITNNDINNWNTHTIDIEERLKQYRIENIAMIIALS